ncbi:MAG: diguanylate cyclase [Ketobacter sp.]|nr:MAG: diguanylate cyclase [Ketobacter sp.]
MSEAVENQMDTDSESQTRILLIDDSKVMRKSAVKMLGNEFDVVVAEDGQQGLDMILDDSSIQVVFTDLNMPKMNGYQLLEAVRTSEDEGVRNLPVIVVTGAENDDEAKEKALQQGATDFITKPFNSTDLKARAHAHAAYQRNTKTLQQVASVDALTGLSNERSFKEHLEKDLSFVARHNHDIAIMLLEVDNFNDLFLKIGRKGADSLIQQIAKVLLKNVRKEDGVGRIGLSRFAISLPTAGPDGATRLAERICHTISGFKAKLRGEVLEISVSIGLYVPADKGTDLYSQCMMKTEQALNHAVDAGGNQVHALIDSSDRVADSGLQDVTDFSIDTLLATLTTEGAAAIEDQIPLAMQRLLPLWQALTPEQRSALLSQIESA